MDIAKIRGELGWEPRESFDSGLRKTVDLVSPEPMVVGADLVAPIPRRAFGVRRAAGQRPRAAGTDDVAWLRSKP